MARGLGLRRDDLLCFVEAVEVGDGLACGFVEAELIHHVPKEGALVVAHHPVGSENVCYDEALGGTLVHGA